METHITRPQCFMLAPDTPHAERDVVVVAVNSIANALRRLGIAASSSKIGGIFYHQISRRIDRVLIPWSGARLSMGPPGRTVLITTTGARSGRPRVASLAFAWEGDDMIVIASKGGAEDHPAWYYNLKANPRVRVQHRAGIEERIAREATGQEREKLYARMARDFPNFAAYQKRAMAASGRKIPVLVLGLAFMQLEPQKKEGGP